MQLKSFIIDCLGPFMSIEQTLSRFNKRFSVSNASKYIQVQLCRAEQHGGRAYTRPMSQWHTNKQTSHKWEQHKAVKKITPNLKSAIIHHWQMNSKKTIIRKCHNEGGLLTRWNSWIVEAPVFSFQHHSNSTPLHKIPRVCLLALMLNLKFY